MNTSQPEPPAGGSPAGRPTVDLGPVLAAMQDQIDDLTAAVEAQQRTLDEHLRAPHPHGSNTLRPAGPGDGAGGR